MPHYSYCSSAILQIFLCCVYFGNCCQMLTIWTLSSFLKAALSFCLEDASVPGSHDVSNCIVTWETWRAPPEVMGSRKGVRAQGLGLPCHLSTPGLVMQPGSADSWLPPPCAADHWRFHIKGRAAQERGDKGSRMTSSTHIRGDEGWNKPEKVNQGFQHRSQFCAALGGEEHLWKSAQGVPWAAVPTFAQWSEPNALEIQRRSRAA